MQFLFKKPSLFFIFSISISKSFLKEEKWYLSLTEKNLETWNSPMFASWIVIFSSSMFTTMVAASLTFALSMFTSPMIANRLDVRKSLIRTEYGWIINSKMICCNLTKFFQFEFSIPETEIYFYYRKIVFTEFFQFEFSIPETEIKFLKI